MEFGDCLFVEAESMWRGKLPVESWSWLLAFTGVFLVATSMVKADPITFAYGGQVTGVDDPVGTLGGAIQVGNSVYGTYTFESTTPDSSGQPDEGLYNGAMLGWDGQIGVHEFSLGNFSSIFVHDAPNNDIYRVFARLLAPFGEDMVWNAVWNFDDPTGSLLSSAALPVDPPDVVPLQGNESTFVQFSDESTGGPIVVSIHLDFLTTLGDMDCDGDLDFDDIDDFVLGLNEPTAYENLYGVPSSLKGDADRDGDLDFDDISGFVSFLGPSSQARLQSIPEPSAHLLWVMGSLLLCCALRGRSVRRGTAVHVLFRHWQPLAH
jgi:hypothetical protein